MSTAFGRTLLRVVLGQFLAMCMSITGLFTTLLVEDNSSLPLLQSVTAYTMIAVLFSGIYLWFVVRHKTWINETYVKGGLRSGNEIATHHEQLPLCEHLTTGGNENHPTNSNQQQCQNEDTLRKLGHERDLPSQCTSPVTKSVLGITQAPNDDEVNNKNSIAIARPPSYSPPHQHLQHSSSPSSTSRIVRYFKSALSNGYKGVGTSLWRFAFIALIDLEANFAVVFAYQYTDITSVQLLDCSSIVWVMALSWAFLGARYKPLYHIVGAVIGVIGIVLLIVFDTTNMNRTADDSSHGCGNATATTAMACEKKSSEDGGKNILLGDMLCIISSLLYAISNVACERLVKKSLEDDYENGGSNNSLIVDTSGEGRVGDATTTASPSPPLREYGATHSNDRQSSPQKCGIECASSEHPKGVPSLQWIVIIEYLFWMPLFGALFGFIQFWATGEYAQLPPFNQNVTAADVAFARVANGESYVDLFYQFGFGSSMLVIYTLMPVLFCVASATFANLSLLTSDIFSIFWNVTVFGIVPKPTFFISFVLIIAGVVIFDTNGFEVLRERKKDDPPENDKEVVDGATERRGIQADAS